MLMRPKKEVSEYLGRAAAAAAKAAGTQDEAREFHLRMEAKWMGLAASAALVERLKDFLSYRDRESPAGSDYNTAAAAQVNWLRLMMLDQMRQIVKLQAALRFYADERLYGEEGREALFGDGGAMARHALGWIGQEYAPAQVNVTLNWPEPKEGKRHEKGERKTGN